jgi:HlyD family secretion protein
LIRPSAAEIAERQDAQAQEQLRMIESGPRREKLEAQRAQLAQSEAALRAIDAALANLTIRAPFAGTISIRHREPGEVVPAGSAILTLLNPEDRWIRVYISETRIAVHLGQEVEIRADTYPERRWREVSFIAGEAEFTPKTVQTAEERVKLVYAVKVRITLDPSHDLKPGMPADVRFESMER